jgi:hypothetical protein
LGIVLVGDCVSVRVRVRARARVRVRARARVRDVSERATLW